MNKLEEIRKHKLSFDEEGNEYLEKDDIFLLRAAEQLVKYIRAMKKTAPYPSVQRRLLEQILDPDIRELVESD